MHHELSQSLMVVSASSSLMGTIGLRNGCLSASTSRMLSQCWNRRSLLASPAAPRSACTHT